MAWIVGGMWGGGGGGKLHHVLKKKRKKKKKKTNRGRQYQALDQVYQLIREALLGGFQSIGYVGKKIIERILKI